MTDANFEVKPGWHGKLNMCLQIGAVIGCLGAPVAGMEGSEILLNYL